MVPTSRPAAWSERIAVSRPEPGPLTKTSTFFIPCSCALRAAFSAASWAANGVDLREPLNPTWPEDAHEMTVPAGSVIDTIVFEKVLLMCAAPCGTFFLSLRRLPLALRDLGGIAYLAFFLPAMVFFGPLRLRALVLVRWPWTGRPRRWRRPW